MARRGSLSSAARWVSPVSVTVGPVLRASRQIWHRVVQPIRHAREARTVGTGRSGWPPRRAVGIRSRGTGRT